MSFLDFLRGKHPIEVHRSGEVKFLCEQDGEAEQNLKRALMMLLRESSDIMRAYLVRVQYNRQDTTHVVLCLEARVAKKALVTAVSKEFGRMFSNTEHLDVLYLSSAESEAISRVANPFYSRTD
jgi:hypothetical protein